MTDDKHHCANDLLVTLQGLDGTRYIATASCSDLSEDVASRAGRFYGVGDLRVLPHETIRVSGTRRGEPERPAK